ncbi:hypothetical protein BOTBODRAFT_134946 [Botryobasidium botryosum FD-172 SS1]|uniref:PAN2-PAN3 deadenylation complex catalytic subunit PAN2 n=1 Tax=Botryobasidium botryosum (strain FD-172 SS1) TaxID=930990 RepID=A0A067MA09_BOTB1|nr:hypothetical protein BOTBODRAFT_134946 [Botryobasidium botryosum FD-172 SS1]
MPTYHLLHPLGDLPDAYPAPITSLAFDPLSDVLWSGSASGSVAAFYGSGLRGVKFPVGGNATVLRIIASEKDVKAIGSEGIGSWSKGGVNKWHYSATQLTNFAMHPTTPHTLVLASATLANPVFQLLNSATGAQIRTVPSPAFISHLRSSPSLLLSASSDGFLRTHDLRTAAKREEGSALAHSGGISGLETSGNYAYTIGWGIRQGHPHPDPLVKVFDLRTLRPLPPYPFSSGPAFIDIHPKNSSVIVVSSSQGFVNVVDVANPTTGGEFHQVDTASYLTSSAISPSGDYLSFGDADGLIHLLTTTAEDTHVPFNGFDGQPIEWADQPEPLPNIHWTDSTPLNSIGLPYYTSPLLSSYTHPLIPSSTAHPPPAPIPPQVLASMKMVDFVGYAQLPKELRGKRNVVARELVKKDQGRFRSDRTRTDSQASIDASDLTDPIPKPYRRVEIMYSKFGVEDFDFGFYNETEFSGLESHIQNSYTNSLVQVLHYCHPIRHLGKSHITTSCRIEHCLLCEFGFVVRMLEDAKGTNCQASNFCKTISRMSQATALGVVDTDAERPDTDYASMIQLFNRFALEEISAEGNAFPQNPIVRPTNELVPMGQVAAPITQLLGIDSTTVIVCQNCGAKRTKEGMTHVVDLLYPRKTLTNEPPVPTDLDFATLMAISLLRDTTYKATCPTCKQLTQLRSRRTTPVSQLPPLLAVNASVNNDEQLKYWIDGKQGTFLSPQVDIRSYGEAESEDLDVATYELRAFIVQVRASKANHLVAIVKVPEAPPDQSPWYIFNDFVVENISEQEALSFPDKWKVPCVLYFERVDMRDHLDFSGLPDELDRAILGQRISLATNVNWAAHKHEPLRYEELPTPGTLVSIDAEFVALQKEESEVRSDGTKKLLRPSQLTLARVSVLRGDGPQAGKPFIDDYIHTSETVVDYLTEYSGIRFGDLDPHFSTHTLLPLKVVYKKLRLLVDLGCIFIGHGLSKDFRIINLFVPPEQVIDTVDLYYIKSRQRRISLRFLSWYILKENIQKDTHDSIEDARAALLLYQEYQRFEEEGKFDQVLEDMYKEGRLVNWKPPTPPPPPQPSAPTTPQRTPVRAGPISPYSPMNLGLQQGGMMPAMPPSPFGMLDPQTQAMLFQQGFGLQWRNVPRGGPF